MIDLLFWATLCSSIPPIAWLLTDCMNSTQPLVSDESEEVADVSRTIPYTVPSTGRQPSVRLEHFSTVSRRISFVGPNQKISDDVLQILEDLDASRKCLDRIRKSYREKFLDRMVYISSLQASTYLAEAKDCDAIARKALANRRMLHPSSVNAEATITRMSDQCEASSRCLAIVLHTLSFPYMRSNRVIRLHEKVSACESRGFMTATEAKLIRNRNP